MTARATRHLARLRARARVRVRVRVRVRLRVSCAARHRESDHAVCGGREAAVGIEVVDGLVRDRVTVRGS